MVELGLDKLPVVVLVILTGSGLEDDTDEAVEVSSEALAVEFRTTGNEMEVGLVKTEAVLFVTLLMLVGQESSKSEVVAGTATLKAAKARNKMCFIVNLGLFSVDTR